MVASYSHCLISSVSRIGMVPTVWSPPTVHAQGWGIPPAKPAAPPQSAAVNAHAGPCGASPAYGGSRAPPPQSTPARVPSATTAHANAMARRVDFGAERRPAFSATVRDASEYHEELSGIPFFSWDVLRHSVGVQSSGTCCITDIHTEPLGAAPVRYYSKAASGMDTMVVAAAASPDGRTKRVQRVMLGQLWSEAFRLMGIHFIGKLLAFLCNARVTLYGLVPLEALRTQAQRPVPTMVGLWLSIDPADHTQDALLDLQRATVLFTREGVLLAFDAAEYKRLLDVADRRRAIGNTGLPESPMTVEAAKSPPKRLGAEKEVEIFVYDPPLDHPRPAKRTGGFRPFFTRWDAPAGMLDARAAQLLAAAAAHEVRAAAFVAAPPVQPSIVSWC